MGPYNAANEVTPTEGSSADLYVWSPHYIDSAILRDSYNSLGTLVTADRVYYLADANYNVTASVGVVTTENGDAWQVVERYTYTPYGEVTYRETNWDETTSSANSNTTLFAGRTLDTATSLYYNRARYYDATLERFISRDPIGHKGGINVYEYVGDNPLARSDPSGLRGPKFDESVCDRAKQEGLAGNDLGGVVCYMGRAHVCTWGIDPNRSAIGNEIAGNEPEGLKIVKLCLQQHESRHAAYDVKCPNDLSGKLARGELCGVTKQDKTIQECRAYKTELLCLEENISDCAGNEVCEATVNDRIKYIKLVMESWGCSESVQKKVKCRD